MGLIKLAIKFYYDGFNAPVIWLTGHTLGGSSQSPQERAQAFIDFAPSAFFGDALRILGPCSKIEKGLRQLKREQITILADILKVEKDELLTLWVADQIIEVTNDEDVALKAMQVAEKEIISNRKKKGK